jgi:hypothetical protein
MGRIGRAGEGQKGNREEDLHRSDESPHDTPPGLQRRKGETPGGWTAIEAEVPRVDAVVR